MESSQRNNSIVEHIVDGVMLGAVAEKVRQIVFESPDHYVRGLAYPLELLKCIVVALVTVMALSKIKRAGLPLLGHVRMILCGIIIVLVFASSMLKDVDRPWPVRPDWLTENIATIVATFSVVVIVSVWNKCASTRCQCKSDE